MNGATVEFDTTGLEKMVETLDKMGVKVQPAVNKAAQKALTPVKRAVKARAPVASGGGKLKKAISRKREETRYKGKRVYEVTFSNQYNDALQRPIKRPGIYGGKSTKAYYPASQEYGFLTKRKDGKGYEYQYARKFYKYDANPDKGVAARDDLSEWYAKHGDDASRSIKATSRKSRKNTWQAYVETVQGVESRKVEGKYYMREGAEATESQAKKIMVDTMEKELDKLWQEATHA